MQFTGLEMTHCSTASAVSVAECASAHCNHMRTETSSVDFHTESEVEVAT
jgi:hypothetical protein